MSYLRKKRDQRDYRLKQFMISGPRMILPKMQELSRNPVQPVWSVPDYPSYSVPVAPYRTHTAWPAPVSEHEDFQG